MRTATVEVCYGSRLATLRKFLIKCWTSYKISKFLVPYTRMSLVPLQQLAAAA